MTRFADLFCGLGGFHLGLQGTCVWACDSEPKLRKTYELNFGIEPAGDIRKVKVQDIPSFDVLCAGFPCQNFSKSGSLEGIFNSNGTLYKEIFRLAQYHLPKIMLLENVPNILRFTDVIKDIKFHCKVLGYKLNILKLVASDYGVPQIRSRVYFVAFRNDQGLELGPLTTQPPKVLLDIVDPAVPPSQYIQRPDYVLGRWNSEKKVLP